MNLNKDQITAIVTGLLKVIGSILAAKGATAMAAVVTSADTIATVAGLVLTISSFAYSWHYNKTPAAGTAAQSGKVVGLMIGALLLFGPSAFASNLIEEGNLTFSPSITNPLGTNSQAGTIAGVFGVSSTNGVFTSLYKGGGDLLAYVEGVTNGFARISLEGGYLRTKDVGNGGFVNFYVPVSGTNNILGVGFGVAYLNKNWYDGTLSARLGDSIPLPLGLQKYVPLYGYVESGGGYNFGTQQAIAQAFTGASIHYSLWRTAKGNTVDFTAGYAIGTVSDIKGNVQAFGGSLTWTF